MPTATVWSSGRSGEKIRIYLEKKTQTTAFIQMATWGVGQNPSLDRPKSLIAYDLYNIRAVSDSEISCTADGPGPFDPPVDCRLVATAGGGVIAITVPRIIDAQYAVGEDDFEELVVFLKQSKFPKS
ncbi:hypothetical protein [Xanthobacter oligotrophicus]|uniref:hypothetical protein n=1 Tax=Xanthobacter oligotrophicus TaxID=2607286 RepID=UPI0011F383E6|nr:hypothetical protein [Xanthobacter oligotrophicus]MCG5236196.1 hypothetical protein [Xanthobacter oligotrophicus]